MEVSLNYELPTSLYYCTRNVNTLCILNLPLELRNLSEVPLLFTPPTYDSLQTTFATPPQPCGTNKQKTRLVVSIHCHCLRGSVFTKPLLRDGSNNAVLPPLLGADDIENTAPSIVACWTEFTGLVHGNAFIKSVKIN
jgi:hypothetical protein